MARMLWKNRIGEEQTVGNVTFKFVDYVDGKIIMVDSLNHDTHVVSKDVWKRGVFKDIMKKFNPTTSHISEMVEERIVKDVLFKVVKVVKGKVEIIASGCDYVFTMSKKTWKESKVFKNVFALIKKLGLIVKKVVKTTTDVSTYVVKHHYLTDYLLNVKKYEYSEEYGYEQARLKHIEIINESTDFYIDREMKNNNDEFARKIIIDGLEEQRKADIENEESHWTYYYSTVKFAKATTLTDVKKIYRMLSSIEHPDKGGNVMKFRAIKQAYENAKQRIEDEQNKGNVFADLFAEFGF